MSDIRDKCERCRAHDTLSRMTTQRCETLVSSKVCGGNRPLTDYAPRVPSLARYERGHRRRHRATGTLHEPVAVRAAVYPDAAEVDLHGADNAERILQCDLAHIGPTVLLHEFIELTNVARRGDGIDLHAKCL
jgi:hypothetical protein